VGRKINVLGKRKVSQKVEEGRGRRAGELVNMKIEITCDDNF